jgi:hypothetical protein
VTRLSHAVATSTVPWMIPSHPAPLLPLKAWKPTLFSGLALVLGAAAPDLEFVMLVKSDSSISHTIAGQLVFTLPVVLCLHWAITALVLPWMVALLQPGPPWHLEDLGRIRPPEGAGDWLRVALSALVGGGSHVFLDSFTHAAAHTGWLVPYIPALAVTVPLLSVPVHDVLHVACTVLLGAWGVQQARAILRGRRIAEWTLAAPAVPYRRASAFERRGTAGYLLLCALAGVAVGIARAETTDDWMERPVLGAVAFVVYGVLLVATLDRLRAYLAPAKRARPEPTEG